MFRLTEVRRTHSRNRCAYNPKIWTDVYFRNLDIHYTKNNFGKF